MTSSLFWLLLIPAVLTFGLTTWLTLRACDAVERVYRRWIVRREIAQRARERANCDLCGKVVSPHPHVAIREVSNTEGMDHRKSYLVVGNRLYKMEIDRRRQELDGAATAQDRHARRIVH